MLRILILILTLICAGCISDDRNPAKEPVVIAHRGALGVAVEHTAASYRAAIRAGADFLEGDVVATYDGQLVLNHSLTIDKTTNVESVFPMRGRSDGHWYAADFTVDELKTLTVLDTQGAKIMTLTELLDIAQNAQKEYHRSYGLYIEIKNSDFHHREGFDIEIMLINAISQAPKLPISIQAHNPQSLKRLKFELKSNIPLIQIIYGSPEDHMTTPDGLEKIARYASGIMIDKLRIETTNCETVNQNALIRNAHDYGLFVNAYTFGGDKLPSCYDSLAEQLMKYHTVYGLDGFVVNNTSIAVDILHNGSDNL